MLLNLGKLTDYWKTNEMPLENTQACVSQMFS